MEEMRNIRPTHTNTGRVSYQAINPTVHDDLLFAALLAWWRVCNNIRSVQ
jgi:hypothetical protein